jgi:tRNA modification GTPase
MRGLETIAAISTPPGRGGVGIVRVSGPQVPAIARAVTGGPLKPRYASLRTFRDGRGEAIDAGIALYFPAPSSYTGEDVLELQGHGGPVVLDLVLARLLELGARPARPGEFTERAFLHGKLDLLQAEAVADLIESATGEAARCARRTLEGVFSRRLTDIGQGLIAARVRIEAAIDFPDDDIELTDPGTLADHLDTLTRDLDDLLAAARQGQLLREGARVAIVGRPNVGKSSLLNALTGRDTAIVTEHPGTTRDPVRGEITINGVPLHLVDTAGLRATLDPVERIGVERAAAALADAEAVLLVVDATLGFGSGEESIEREIPPGTLVLRVFNKVDLTGEAPRITAGSAPLAVHLSALTGRGLDLLLRALRELVGEPGTEGLFIARRRHLYALRRARAHLAAAAAHLAGRVRTELAAEDLRGAQVQLGTVTGEVTTEDLLDEIFSTFCIGK